MLKREIVEYVDDFYHVRITVGQATVREGLRRSALIAKRGYPDEAELEELRKGFDPVRFVEDQYLLWTYPACVAGTVEIENLDPEKPNSLSLEVLNEGSDTFLDLPDALVIIWENAVLEVNPHWSPFFDRGAKKAPMSEENDSQKNESDSKTD